MTKHKQLNIRVGDDTIEKIDRLRRISVIKPIPSASEIVRWAIDRCLDQAEREVREQGKS